MNRTYLPIISLLQTLCVMIPNRMKTIPVVLPLISCPFCRVGVKRQRRDSLYLTKKLWCCETPYPYPVTTLMVYIYLFACILSIRAWIVV
jgi:hypothetical protein